MLNRKGQNIAEYSILIALVIAAAVAMQVYVKRGIQGRVADAVDYAPKVEVLLGVENPNLEFTTKQYEPYYTESSGEVTSDRAYSDTLGARGQTGREITKEDTTRGKDATEKSKWTGFTKEVYDAGR